MAFWLQPVLWHINAPPQAVAPTLGELSKPAGTRMQAQARNRARRYRKQSKSLFFSALLACAPRPVASLQREALKRERTAANGTGEAEAPEKTQRAGERGARGDARRAAEAAHV